MTARFYVPVPEESDSATVVRPVPPIEAISGMSVGFLGNLKPNADVMLHTIEAALLGRGAADAVYREKESFAAPAPDSTLEEIERYCQAAILATAD